MDTPFDVFRDPALIAGRQDAASSSRLDALSRQVATLEQSLRVAEEESRFTSQLAMALLSLVVQRDVLPAGDVAAALDEVLCDLDADAPLPAAAATAQSLAELLRDEAHHA